MRISLGKGDRGPVAFIGERSVRSVAGEIESLRQRSGQGSDVLTSMSWFLPHAARSKSFPVVVRVRDETAGHGFVLLEGRKKLGMPTGVLKGGSLCGRGAVVGPEAQRPDLVEAAARLLFRTPLAHTVIVTLLRREHMLIPRGSNSLDPCYAEQRRGPWHMRETRNRLSLTSGIEGLLSRFSTKMRRNFRYYRQRAERDFGCVFHPQLSHEQSRAAVLALHGHGSYAVSRWQALQHEASLRAVPGSFVMGLTDASGKWLSLLSGWRRPEASYIEWQINAEEPGAASVSATMRNYWLHHEISLGVPRVVFVGETTPVWSRACEPEVCGEFLAMRGGLVGFAARHVGRRLRPSGKLSELDGLAGTTFYPSPPGA